MGDILQDLRYGLRGFRSSPGFTIIAIAALALGIGATTAMFSVVDRVILRPLPYPEPDQLVSLGNSIPHPDYFDWRARNHVFEDMTAYRGTAPRTLTGREEATQISCADVSASFFNTFRVQPVLGRAFTPDEDKPGAPKVIVLTYEAWKTRFGGSRDILGRSLTLNDTPYTVIGVMGPEFRFPGERVEALTPLSFNAAFTGTYFFPVVARLKSGVSVAQASAEIEGFWKTSTSLHSFGEEKIKVSAVRLQDQQVANVRLAMLALLGAVACVLLIACANIANLLMARSASRQREIAVRAALGAGRMRLLRQFLTESVMLGLAGGAAGFLLAAGSLKSIVHLAAQVPRIDEVSIDWRVLGFTLAVSLIVSLLFGIAPALNAARADVNDALKRGAASATAKNRWLRSTLVTAELALSLVLLTGAGLLLETLWKLEHIQTGIVAEHVLTANVHLSYKQYPPSRRDAFFDDLIARVSALPSVTAAAATSGLPPYWNISAGLNVGSAVEENAHPGDQVGFRDVTPGYFSVMRIPLREGRTFTSQDRKGPPVAVINEALARHFFPNEDPVGKQVSAGKSFDHLRTIIGVVGDVKNQGMTESARPELYRLDEEGNLYNFVVRTAGDPLSLTAAIREQVRELDKNAPLKFSTMTDEIDREFSSQRFNSIILSVFAAIALLLAAIGIYGIMSYLVSLRVQEIGIRMALGARSNQVLGMVIGQALRLIGAGLACGIALALALTRYLENLLYGVKPGDVRTFASVAFLLCGSALLASYFPAYRASRVDPLTALRSE